MNLIGEKVKKISTVTNYPIDVQVAVPPGIYFVNVTTKEGGYNKKIVVAK